MKDHKSTPQRKSLAKRFMFVSASSAVVLAMLLSYQNCAQQHFSGQSSTNKPGDDTVSGSASGSGASVIVKEGETKYLMVILPSRVNRSTVIGWDIPGADGDIRSPQGSVTLTSGDDSFVVRIEVPPNDVINRNREYRLEVIDPSTGQMIAGINRYTIQVIDMVDGGGVGSDGSGSGGGSGSGASPTPTPRPGTSPTPGPNSSPTPKPGTSPTPGPGSSPTPTPTPADAGPQVFIQKTPCSKGQYCQWTFSVYKTYPKEIRFKWETVKPRSYPPADSKQRWGVEGSDFVETNGEIIIPAGKYSGTTKAEVLMLVDDNIAIPIDMVPCFYGGVQYSCVSMFPKN